MSISCEAWRRGLFDDSFCDISDIFNGMQLTVTTVLAQDPTLALHLH